MIFKMEKMVIDMNNKNLLVVIIFLIVIFNSIVYSALNTEMFINGDAHIRIDKNIRITDVKVLEQLNDAYETYSSDYSKNTTSMQVTLPSSESVMIYEITITNKSDIDYEVTEIIEESYSNSDIKYELIDIEKGTLITGETTHIFKIKFTTTENNSDNKTTLVLKYTFQEIIKEWSFNYTGNEQEFSVPYNGVYKLEVWGAQGATHNSSFIGGYGGYSSGESFFNKDSLLYINVGGAGTMGPYTSTHSLAEGGYNGGGKGATDYCYQIRYGGSGGGATHISTSSGIISQLSDKVNNIYIVAGGGGGAYYFSSGAYGSGASGGGYIGNTADWTNVSHRYKLQPTGGNQISGGSGGSSYDTNIAGSGSFGQGGFGILGSCGNSSGGGGGYYGGGSGNFAPGAGGSGYISNKELTNKNMYCFNCSESNEESTKTISTTNVSENPISNYAKKGNGYAKITYIGKK